MKHTFDAAGPGDNEELVQRFVDQELSAEERVRFLSRLGRDEALRRRTIELEQLVLDASRLPRPIVPDGFAASVIGRLPHVVQGVSPARKAPAARPSSWRRLADALFAPREIHWNLANAMTVAAAAVLVMAAILTRAGLKPGTTTALTPGATALAAASPTTFVRLVIMQPGAKSVQVAGDFNEWNPARTSLDQISTGAWAVTIPLKPGRYAYMFVVDGKRWVADPFAAEQSDDGFGSRNAVLEVRPPENRVGAAAL
jgi:anti-sigma factor RsiW